ncbi:Zn peptidase and DNA-binding HTH-like domain [Deinococcus geothermalis DSM 11300]|uniref:Zn peptidase and DNA-binding HTH-like domain n=1 Tax=Deinococcus geothermalis (strain DSM 11300 / CIP 105573 / AG-3a) TaxID=319795 RepID=Q1IX30_DEIGD|nr:XRE family transcriptional regulator [Deinococcus geothermalis]ABF46204.1 Zn peptidase and DNA-binding HTH-like domain [Deinococcus geothermalis DSM 11300]
MRKAKPFQGWRLKQAREAYGLSLESLGELVGVSKQAISKMENDVSEPSPEVFLKICQSLKRPAEFFYSSESADFTNEMVFFRRLKKSPVISQKSARVMAEWVSEMFSQIMCKVKLPKYSLPDYSKDFMEIDSDYIEECALNLRSFLGLEDKPISNLTKVLESRGVLIARMRFYDERIDALSVIDSKLDRPIIVLNSDKASAVRSRFDLAHELGHLILHAHVRPDDFKAHYNLIESQAHRFASAFLMPKSGFKKFIFSGSLNELKSIKMIWKTSIAAMIYRMKDLGMLTEDDASKAWKNYYRRGWRGDEPYDDEILPEEPELLRRSIDLLIDRGIISGVEIESYFAKDIPLIERISNVNLKLDYPDIEVRSNLRLSI